MSKSKIGAFFDMDKTLIAENSGSIYFREAWERGEVKALDVARGVGAYLQYKLGTLDITRWTERMLGDLAGQREAFMYDEGRALFERRVKAKIYPEAARLVALRGPPRQLLREDVQARARAALRVRGRARPRGVPAHHGPQGGRAAHQPGARPARRRAHGRRAAHAVGVAWREGAWGALNPFGELVYLSATYHATPSTPSALYPRAGPA